MSAGAIGLAEGLMLVGVAIGAGEGLAGGFTDPAASRARRMVRLGAVLGVFLAGAVGWLLLVVPWLALWTRSAHAAGGLLAEVAGRSPFSASEFHTFSIAFLALALAKSVGIQPRAWFFAAAVAALLSMLVSCGVEADRERNGVAVARQRA